MDAPPPGYPHPPPPPQPPPPPERQSGPPPAKRQKVAIACDVCRAKKVKCDGLRPVCSPCARRSDRGVPCEYTSEVRTSHGPSKGYVHHLELKLRELQAEKVHSPIGLPHHPSDLGSSPAINHATSFEASWSSPGPQQLDFGAKHLPPRNYSAQPLTNGSRAYESSAQPRPSPSLQQYQLTPTPIPTGQRPFVLKKARARQPQSLLSGPDYADLALLGSKPAGSFLHQVKAALDSRSQIPSGMNAPGLSGTSMPQLPIIQPKAHDGPRIEYVLPSRKTADALLEVYWNAVYPFHPFLDRRQFQSMYDGIWAGEPSECEESLMMCILNVVFALASQLSENLPPKERESSALRYFDRAQDLLSLDLWGIESVQLVQCLLLMSQYLQSTNPTNQAWVLTGLAVRKAEGLGLHLPGTSIGIDNPYQRELVRRVWHGCVLMDRTLSMQLNRPAMVDKLSSHPVPLPVFVDDEHLDRGQPSDQPAVITFYIKAVELSEITAALAQTSMPFSNPGAELFPSYEPYHLYFGDSSASQLTETLRLDRSLTTWASSLPIYLSSDTTGYRFENGMPIFRHQANVLLSRFLHARILLFRSLLSRFCFAQPEPSDPSSPSLPAPPPRRTNDREAESLPHHLALSCSSLCLRAAHQAIQLLHSNLDQTNITGPVPGWWECVLLTYSAATVLQAARLRPIAIADHDIDTSWAHALDILRVLEALSPRVERSRIALEILDARITTALTGGSISSQQNTRHDNDNKDDDGNGNDSADPATATATTEAEGSLLPANDGSGASEVVVGSANISAGPAVDFDLNDMSWLTSTPLSL